MKIVGWTHDISPKHVKKGDQLAFRTDEDMDIALAIFLGEGDTAGSPGAGYNDYSINLLCRVIAQLHEENEELKTKVKRYVDLDQIVMEQAKKLAELGEKIE